VARGVLAVADTVKDGAADVVAALRGLGLEVAMLTGDNARTARPSPRASGSTGSSPRCYPEDKQSEVERLQAAGEKSSRWSATG
jgi:copper-transporting P-type ATPase V